MNTNRAPSLVIAASLGFATAFAPIAAAGGSVGPQAYIIEGSGFFNVPGVEIGSAAIIDLTDPSIVIPIPRVGDEFRFGGVGVVPGTNVPLAFENTTNSIRAFDPAAAGNTLIDSTGFHDSGTAGIAFSVDGSVTYTTTTVSQFGRIVASDTYTAEILSVTDIVNFNFSSLATAPATSTLPEGTLIGLGIAVGNSLLLHTIDLDNAAVTNTIGVSGIGFSAEFETGLDFAPDGTLYAIVQGFQQIGFDGFIEISSRLFTIDPVTGQATLIGIVGDDFTWDGVGLAIIDDAPACPIDLAAPAGTLDDADVAAAVALVQSGDAAIDLTGDGLTDARDLIEYLKRFDFGCGFGLGPSS